MAARRHPALPLSLPIAILCLAALVMAGPLPPPPPFLAAAPIWSHDTTQFALFRSPEFKLRATPLSAELFFAAEGSPRPPEVHPPVCICAC